MPKNRSFLGQLGHPLRFHDRPAFNRSRSSRGGRKTRRDRRLRLESLEQRKLLAAVIAPVDAELVSQAGSYLDYGTSGSHWYDGSGLSDATIVETGDPVPTVWPEHIAGNNSTRVSRIRDAPEVNTLTFDLGGTFDVSGMVLWNSTEAGQSDRGFENTVLSYSTDGGTTFTGSDTLTWTQRVADESANQGNTPTPPVAMFSPEVQMLPGIVAGVTHIRMDVDNFSTAGVDAIVMASEIRFIGDPVATTSGIYNEENGLVVMEMENTPSDLGVAGSGWLERTQYANYTGDGYLQFDGNTPSAVRPSNLWNTNFGLTRRACITCICARPKTTAPIQREPILATTRMFASKAITWLALARTAAMATTLRSVCCRVTQSFSEVL